MSEREFSIRNVVVCAPESGESVAEALCTALPNVARLEFARVTGAKEAQAQIARITAEILHRCLWGDWPPTHSPGRYAHPDHVADPSGRFDHLHCGKSVTPRVVGEFLGALGFNIGAGILFREGARAIIRIVPIWGNAVSGMIAGAGITR